MLKHIGHSHHGKLHTFDDFYRDNNSKPIKTRSTTNDLTTTTNSSPTSPCSPNSNPYTFYNIFSDFKSSVTPNVVPEEDETEEDEIEEEDKISPEPLTPPTAVFYLEDEPTNHSQTSSPHWPSLILNRFRHGHHHHHGMIKQTSINDNHLNLSKLRKSDSTDTSSSSSSNKHRFLKRSQTLNHADNLTDKKPSNDDFPELSLSTNNINKKHRSFVSLLHHFHQHTNSSKKHPDRSNSTGTLNIDKVNTNSNEISRHKLIKQKTLPSTNNDEPYSPVKKSPSTQMLPKLASFFHRHHLPEQHKHRVGNLKARLHHRRNSPPLTNTAPKFQCQISNELIEEIKKLEQEQYIDQDSMRYPRSAKPVVMKRVQTWHNSFDLRPVDQCLEY